MVPLIIHLSSYFLLLAARKVLYPINSFFKFTNRAEAISIGIMFLATGIAHFTSTTSMVDMFPRAVPLKKELVLLSGIFELIAAIFLIVNGPFQKQIGILLLAFLILSLPLNIYSAVANVGMGAKGIGYLWFRIPLQVFWFIWIYFFVIVVKSPEYS